MRFKFPSHRQSWVAACLIVFLMGVFGFGSSWAVGNDTTTTAMSLVESSAQQINSDLVATCMKTLAAALLLQLILSHWKDVFTGDIGAMIPKFVGAMMWGSFCFWVMNNLSFLSDMFNGYLALTTGISGVNFAPGDIWAKGVGLQDGIVTAFNKGSGSDWNPIAAAANIFSAIQLFFVCALILVAYGVISLSVLVARCEFWLMFAVAPIAAALLGLQAFRDQGIAPFKGVISLGMRVIILGVIVKISDNIGSATISIFSNSIPSDKFMPTAYMALGGMLGCAVMAFSAGKIASSIASGTANFSGTDAIKGGMSMVNTAMGGAALAGGAMAAGGVLATTASKAAAEGATKTGGILGNMLSSGLSVGGHGPGGSSPMPGGAMPTKPTGGVPGGASSPMSGGNNFASGPSVGHGNSPAMSADSFGEAGDVSAPMGGVSGGTAPAPASASATPASGVSGGAGQTPPAGSGVGAGIGAPSGGTVAGAPEHAVLQALQQMTESMQPRAPGWKDHFKSAGSGLTKMGETMAQHDSAQVGVSINVHAKGD